MARKEAHTDFLVLEHLHLSKKMNFLDFKLFERNVRQMRDALGAVKKYAESDFKNVGSDIFEKRKLICRTCEFWDEDGWFGKGKCNKCGCSSLKLRIAVAECPIGKWSKENLDLSNCL